MNREKESVPLSVKCLVKGVRGRRKILQREIIQRKMREEIMKIKAMKVEIETAIQ
jgi:heme exporter protein D